MIVLEKYIVKWTHSVSTNERLSRAGKPIVSTIWLSECNIIKIDTTDSLAVGYFAHKSNHYNRKEGVKQSFKIAVSQCPKKDLRDAFWAEYWRIRKPKITVSEDTAQLLRFLPYIGYELHKNVQREDENGYNEGWQYLTPLDIAKRIGSRLLMYRDKSELSLIAIMRLCTIGYINFKRLKDGQKTH